jgi:hypothetical protein
MVKEKKWKVLSDIGLDGHTKDGSILAPLDPPLYKIHA